MKKKTPKWRHHLETATGDFLIFSVRLNFWTGSVRALYMILLLKHWCRHYCFTVDFHGSILWIQRIRILIFLSSFYNNCQVIQLISVTYFHFSIFQLPTNTNLSGTHGRCFFFFACTNVQLFIYLFYNNDYR